MRCLITYDDAEGLSISKAGLHLHPLSNRTDVKCNMSLKLSCYAFYHLNRYFYHQTGHRSISIRIGLALSFRWEKLVRFQIISVYFSRDKDKGLF